MSRSRVYVHTHTHLELFTSASHDVLVTFGWLCSSGNVKTPISPSNSSNTKKKVVEVQKPVVEQRQEEVGSKYVR